MPEAARGPGQAPVGLGVAGHDGDQPEVRRAPQGVHEDVGHVLGPEVLVLQVDEAPGPSQRLAVGPGHAALAVGGVGQRRPLVRVGAQHLHGRRAGGSGIAWHGGQGSGVAGLGGPAGQPPCPRGAGVERPGVLPAFPEGGGQVADGGAPDLELDVVPRRAGAVALVELDGLGVAQVPFVVVAPVAQVDAPDEGDVPVLLVGVADEDQLLVVRPGAAHPLVEQDLAPGLVHHVGQVDGLLLAQPGLVGVRAPHEAADVDAPAGETGEHLTELGAGPDEELVGVAPPVGEVDPGPVLQGGQLLVEAAEVGGPVDQRLHRVAVGPRPAVVTAAVDVGVEVAPLVGGEEPGVGEGHGASGPARWRPRGRPPRPRSAGTGWCRGARACRRPPSRWPGPGG